VIDPLFGVALPAGTAGFERAPPALIAQCGIGPAGSEQESWIFGAAEAPDGKYFVLGGRARFKGRPWVENRIGELVRLNGSGCVVIDPPREALAVPQAATIPLPASLVAQLANDAVARLIHGFGSRRQLITALRTQGHYPDGGGGAAVLRRALETSPLP
jgi:hypothetical protein